MNDHNAGPNQRIEPIPATPGIHLHEKSGSGLNSASKKDPSAAINPDPNSGYGMYPPPTLIPPIFPVPEFPGASVPPPIIPFPNDNLPPEGPIPGQFPFIYFEGAWWAWVEVDCDAVPTDGGWVQFAPVCCNCPPAVAPMQMLGVATPTPE